MDRSRLVVDVTVRMVVMILIIGGLLFGFAGTIRYWQAWLYMAVLYVPSIAVTLYFFQRDPGFIERRMKWRERERAQQVGQSLIALLYISQFVVAGLDHRFGWSSVSPAFVIAADVLSLIGFWFIFIVFQVNRYAASTVEVEQGQQVISTGPYSLVRHPMYLGGLLMLLFSPLALGSWWAMIFGVLISFGLVFRIKNEEEVLVRDLPGYEDYRSRVRWRLIPGVW